jgi:hypothetical protein
MWVWIMIVSMVSATLIAVYHSLVSLHTEQALVTVGFCFCSAVVFGAHIEGVGHPESVRVPSFKAEVIATLCWLGMSAALTCEGVRTRHTEKRYDAKAFAVTCFAFFEL